MMGIPDSKIFSVLSSMRQYKNYTSLGEVGQALDIMENERKEEELKHQ